MVNNDLWSHLRAASESGRVILLYGMGDGADKILAVCAERGIAIADTFASDAFVRGQSFHGKTVLTYSEAVRKYGDFTVLVGFATSLPEVLQNVENIASERELYIPSVPVCPGEVFDDGFYSKHKVELDAARSLFADEVSRLLFDEMIAFNLTGRAEYLFKHVASSAEVYGILDISQVKTSVDAGAYIGDSATELLAFVPNIEQIFALEPDPKTFSRLQKNLATELRVTPINAAAWSENTTLRFSASGNRGAGTERVTSSLSDGGKFVEVRAVKIDGLGIIPDYIKFDVEGAEREALLGAAGVIREYSPRLLVSLYHKSRDLFDLPLLVRELNQNYNLYLRRRVGGIPAWDLELLAVM